MKKKIKDLTYTDVVKVCANHCTNCNNCPLYHFICTGNVLEKIPLVFTVDEKIINKEIDL